jgi:hypothetical protein
MNGWKTLLATQQGLRTETLDQYYLLHAINQCAVVLGIQPVQGVTLRSDVLGQTVFSALEKNVVAGGGRPRSEDERRRFMQEVINIVDRTANAAAVYGDVALDTKLTKSQKASKVVDSLGGVPAIIGYVATVGLTAEKVLGKRADDKLSGRMYETMNETMIDGTKAPFAPRFAKVSDVEVSFQSLWTAYRDMKDREDKSIKFLKERLLLPRELGQPAGPTGQVVPISRLNNLMTTAILPRGLPADINLFEQSADDVQKNPLLRALIVWTQIIYRAFDNFITSSPVGQELVATDLDPRIQARLNNAIAEVNKTPKIMSGSKQTQDKKSDLLDVCNRLSEIFQQESIATRFLLQEFIKSSVPNPPKQSV